MKDGNYQAQITHVFSKIDEIGPTLDRALQLQSSLENFNGTASSLKSHQIAFECICDELSVSSDEISIESYVASNEASSLAAKAKEIIKRIYAAIIKSLRFIMKLLFGHNAESRLRSTAISGTIDELERKYKKFKASNNLGIEHTFYRNVYVLSSLHVKGQVTFSNTITFLNSGDSLFRDVQSYQKAQAASLRKLRVLSASDMVTTSQMPLMGSITVCRDTIDTKEKEARSIHPLLVSKTSPAFPGNWCIIQSEVNMSVSPAAYGSEYAVEKAYPFIAQGYGVKIDKADTSIELSSISGNAITTLSVREIMSVLQASAGAHRTYAQFESDIQSMISELDGTLKKLESDQDKGKDIQRAFYKYYVSLAREQVKLAGDFSESYLKTIDAALAHARKSMDMYRSDLK